MITDVKQLISEINRIHSEYSADYFETGRIEKINLSKTMAHVPVEPIFSYRLNLHESINDYLIRANIERHFFSSENT